MSLATTSDAISNFQHHVYSDLIIIHMLSWAKVSSHSNLWSRITAPWTPTTGKAGRLSILVTAAEADKWSCNIPQGENSRFSPYTELEIDRHCVRRFQR